MCSPVLRIVLQRMQNLSCESRHCAGPDPASFTSIVNIGEREEEALPTETVHLNDASAIATDLEVATIHVKAEAQHIVDIESRPHIPPLWLSNQATEDNARTMELNGMWRLQMTASEIQS
mmetsp:Transcript_17069/g.23090  ORF Transcript_17069/g.23090 Transcript_17069/m.23090 type:complete len:120 (+) Transcript_17069:96-455(+)